MFKRLFHRLPARPTIGQSLDEEILSICRASQIDGLQTSPHLLRDVGADCGCLVSKRGP